MYLIITTPQRSWGKVIFSEGCVKNSVAKGGCMARGVWVAGEYVWQGGVRGQGVCAWWGGCVWRGACMARGDIHGRGACLAHSKYYEIQSMRGGTHPTGMHSCFFFIIASTK